MPTTLNVADKPTLNSVKTDTDTLITRGGIRHNGTNPQVYDTTNDTWVDLPSGGSLSPTIIIKNHFYEDGDMDNLDITVTEPVTGWTTTQNMGTADSITVSVPWCDTYTISCTFEQQAQSWIVDVIGVGGVDGTSRKIKVVSFSTGTDEEIKKMLDAYYADEITWAEMGWAVGDTRTISLSSMQAPNPNSSSNWLAQDITVVIVDHDHTTLETPINGHTNACITVQTREVLNDVSSGYNTTGDIYYNGSKSASTTFSPWSNLYMRTYMNSVVLSSFSFSFRSMIKSSTHYRHSDYNTTDTNTVNDTLFLPSYSEIFGTASYSNYVNTNPTEGTQFTYYQTTSNRIKYGNNNGSPNSTVAYWWIGSPASYISSGNYYWLNVDKGGSQDYTKYFSNGLAPAWAM